MICFKSFKCKLFSEKGNWPVIQHLQAAKEIQWKPFLQKNTRENPSSSPSFSKLAVFFLKGTHITSFCSILLIYSKMCSTYINIKDNQGHFSLFKNLLYKTKWANQSFIALFWNFYCKSGDYKVPRSWTEEPGGLQSMGWQRIRHDRVQAHIHSRRCWGLYSLLSVLVLKLAAVTSTWELVRKQNLKPHPKAPQSESAFHTAKWFWSSWRFENPLPCLTVTALVSGAE